MSVVDTLTETKIMGVPAWGVVLVGGGFVAFMLTRPKQTTKEQLLAVPYAEPVIQSIPGAPEVTNVLIRLQNIFAPNVENKTTVITPERPASIQPLPTAPFIPPPEPPPAPAPPPPAPTPPVPNNPPPPIGIWDPIFPVPQPAQPPPSQPPPPPDDPCKNMSYDRAMEILILHPDDSYLRFTMLWSFHRNEVSEDEEERARAGDATARRHLATVWVRIHNIDDLGKFVCEKGWVH